MGDIMPGAEKAEKPAAEKPKFDLDIKDGELVATEVEEETKEVLEENLPADQSFADDDKNEGGEE
jgi:ABC-2 type transport system ATP-binding protein